MSLSLRESSQKILAVNGKNYSYYSLPELESLTRPCAALPKSLKILLENLLRWQDDETVTQQDILSIIDWLNAGKADREIAYRPARVLMQA